jgi:TfoX/Sxy family transcriptional regulator of competence genes
MASSLEFVQYVCEQLAGAGEVRYRKMFGEFMVYVSDKPIFLVCDNTVYVKMLDALAGEMQNAQTGSPYTGAKEHYILDIDDAGLAKRIAAILEPITPIPAPKKKKKVQ